MNDTDSPGPNPPFRVGAPQPPPSLGEMMAFHAYMGTLPSFLIAIGYYYMNPSPSDRHRGRERDRER
jgi:hypothetical protein